MKKTLIIAAVMMVLVGAGAFFGGMKYGQGKNSRNGFRQGNFGNLPDGARQQGMSGRLGNGKNGNGFVNGEVMSKDDKSFTVKLQDGGSKIVFFSDSTQISKSASGSKDDLKTGTNLMITGDTNQDGSVTAKLIQIRPAETK